MLVDNNQIDAETNLPVTEGVSDRAKWAAAFTDQPRFGIRQGYKLLFDPVDDPRTCRDGRLYLFESATGSHFVGEFRHMTMGAYEAVGDNSAPMDTIKHGIRVVAELVGIYMK